MLIIILSKTYQKLKKLKNNEVSKKFNLVNILVIFNKVSQILNRINIKGVIKDTIFHFFIKMDFFGLNILIT